MSSESLEGLDIVPRKKGELTKEDTDILTRQGIPQESWHDDVRIMEARFKKYSERFKNVYVENFDPECKKEHILDRITSLFNNTTEPGGMI